MENTDSSEDYTSQYFEDTNERVSQISSSVPGPEPDQSGKSFYIHGLYEVPYHINDEKKFWILVFEQIDKTYRSDQPQLLASDQQDHLSLSDDFQKELLNVNNNVRYIEWSHLRGLEITQKKRFGYYKTLDKISQMIIKSFESQNYDKNLAQSEILNLIEIADKVIDSRYQKLDFDHPHSQRFHNHKLVLQKWKCLRKDLFNLYKKFKQLSSVNPQVTS